MPVCAHHWKVLQNKGSIELTHHRTMTKDSVTRNERQAGVADADAPPTPGNNAAASNMEETIKRSLMNILSEPASESPSDKMQAEPAAQPTPSVTGSSPSKPLSFLDMLAQRCNERALGNAHSASI
eukprot:SAG31_NODE_12385_length_945_cov_5.969267_2_plen_126_part_00